MALAGSVPAQECQPQWLYEDDYGFSQLNGRVNALAVYDDGDGPALYAGGSFTIANGTTVNRIAKWDSRTWSPLSTGMNGTVSALAVFDSDGDGPGAPELYAGGEFSTAGGNLARRIARWNGTSWASVAGSFAGGPFEIEGGGVAVLLVSPDTASPALYVGGNFMNVGPIPAKGIVKLEAESWSMLGKGIQGFVLALRWHDFGFGSHLFVGGIFSNAGGVGASNIARWDGMNWFDVGGGVNGQINDFEIFDDGSGTKLYAGGQFTTAGGNTTRLVGRWDGSQWSSIGINQTSGSPDVRNLLVHDDGSGQALFIGGDFTFINAVQMNRIMRYRNASLSPVGNGFSQVVYSLEKFDDGKGARLIAGGDIFGNIAKWTGAAWVNLGDGINSRIHTLAVHDDGAGPALYAGGGFTFQGENRLNRIGRWNGSAWTQLADGVSGFVYALSRRSDAAATSGDLYVGGFFTFAGALTVNHIARWDGTSFHTVGQGLNQEVDALLIDDSVNPPVLYAGGVFTASATGTPLNRIGKWNGANWTQLGSGMTGRVQALALFDDGSGTALYAGGEFLDAGASGAQYIARWDGRNWTAVGAGLGAPVTTIAVSDKFLYAAGDFNSVNGEITSVAKWDGSSWSAVGENLGNALFDLIVHDDGTGAGPQLHATGAFDGPTGSGPHHRIARWDGSTWQSLDQGLSGSVPNGQPIGDCLASMQTDLGPHLFVGGQFLRAGSDVSYSLGRWGTLAHPVIDAQPLGGAFGSDSTVTLHVAAHGTGGAIGYQWRHDGMLLKDGGAISGALTDTLVISPFTANEAGNYDVVLTDDCGSTTSARAIVTLPAACAADIAPAGGDGLVDVNDLLSMIGSWGPCPSPCAADVAPEGGDGVVDVNDLLILIGGWGACP